MQIYLLFDNDQMEPVADAAGWSALSDAMSDGDGCPPEWCKFFETARSDDLPLLCKELATARLRSSFTGEVDAIALGCLASLEAALPIAKAVLVTDGEEPEPPEPPEPTAVEKLLEALEVVKTQNGAVLAALDAMNGAQCTTAAAIGAVAEALHRPARREPTQITMERVGEKWHAQIAPTEVAPCS